MHRILGLVNDPDELRLWFVMYLNGSNVEQLRKLIIRDIPRYPIMCVIRSEP
jgi:hypothetical protein